MKYLINEIKEGVSWMSPPWDWGGAKGGKSQERGLKEDILSKKYEKGRDSRGEEHEGETRPYRQETQRGKVPYIGGPQQKRYFDWRGRASGQQRRECIHSIAM